MTSFEQNYNNIKNHIINAYNSLENKGAEIPTNKNIINLANSIDSISNGAKLNVECSLTAPTDTSKLWIKTDNTPSNVIMKDKYTASMNEISQLEGNLPKSGAECSAIVGDNVFIFGGSIGTTIIKYNFTTNTKEILDVELPSARRHACCVAVGTDIYIFGGYIDSAVPCLKFDTILNEITNVFCSFKANNMCCIAVGTNIYLFGGEKSEQTSATISSYTSYSTIYKFNTTTMIYTLLSVALPYPVTSACCSNIGTDIYIFYGIKKNGSSTSSSYIVYHRELVKFDTITESVTALGAKMPVNIYNSCCATLGNDIYIFGGYSKNGSSAVSALKCIYKFDGENFELLDTELPISMYLNSCVYFGESIYIFYKNNIYRFKTEFELENNTLLLINQYSGKSFKLVLFDNTEIYITITNCFVGNSENKAEQVKIALYDNITESWVDLN